MVGLGGRLTALSDNLDGEVNNWLAENDVVPVCMTLTTEQIGSNVVRVGLALAYQPRAEWEHQQAAIRAMADTIRLANRLELAAAVQEDDHGRTTEEPERSERTATAPRGDEPGGTSAD